jgi:[CysO sulfur-carrier protein]-S-L-cysteine hydrolase
MDRGDLFALMNSLIINTEQLQTMIQHVEAELPLEACGLLSGKDSRVRSVHVIRNQAQSPVRFVMDPLEQLTAFEWVESQKLDLLAIFHSHPAGPETVSATDIAEAAYPVVHIILSRSGGEWQARGFWIENGQASEVTLQVI